MLFNPSLIISSISSGSASLGFFLKILFHYLFVLFQYPYLQVCPPLSFLFVQRLYFGVKHSALFLIVVNMILRCISQLFVIFHFEPSSLCTNSMKLAIYQTQIVLI